MAQQHVEKVWQPGERAMFCNWKGEAQEPVTVIRYSRSRLFRNGVLVRDDEGKRFTVAGDLLAEGPEEAR